MSAAKHQQHPQYTYKNSGKKQTRAQLHLEQQRHAYRLLCELQKLSIYEPEADANFAALDEGMQWLPYLSKTLKQSETEVKKLLVALEDSGYIRPLAGFVGNIKLLDKTIKVRKRVNLGGGYCGHDNDCPEFELARPVNIGKRYPSLIINSMTRVTEYYRRPDLIPSLKYCQPHKKGRTKKGISRRQYSQRRYACVVVIAALLKRMDIKTLQIVVSDAENNLYHCKVKVLVNDTGLPQRRVERALADIKDASIVHVLARPTYRDEKGKLCASPAVRAFNESFFGILGFASALEKEREKREERKIKQNKKLQEPTEDKPINKSGQHRVKLIFDAAQKRQAKAQQQLFENKQQNKKSAREQEELKKSYYEKMAELHATYKGEKDLQEIRRLAKKLTGYTGD